MKWPNVLTEEETLEGVHQGMCLARFGDGELKLATGSAAVSQEHTSKLRTELREILSIPTPGLIVGIPRQGIGPKAEFWKNFAHHFYTYLFNSEMQYGSSLLTRFDSCPWLNTLEYRNSVAKLWQGKSVILVCGSSKGFDPIDLYATGATLVKEVRGRQQHSYSVIDDLEFDVTQLWETGIYHIVLMCLGATATCLAARLCKNGIHAVDIGHLPMFLRNDKWKLQQDERKKK